MYTEATTLTADPPDGIKVFPNEEGLTDLQVTIEGPEGTPYAGGLFRTKLLLGKDFPASAPKGYFLTKIFHPNVGASGEICVNVLRRGWTAELGIWHVLLTITCLLTTPNPASALKEEAGGGRTCSQRSPGRRRAQRREGPGRPPPPTPWLLGAREGPRGPWPRSTRVSMIRSWQTRKRRTRSRRCSGCSGLSSLPPPPTPHLTPTLSLSYLNYGWGGGGHGGTGTWICFSK